MDDNKESFLKIDKNLEFLNSKITVLQDLILNMKNEFDLINRAKIYNHCISELTEISEVNLDSFINTRPGDCKVLDQCTTYVEKATMKFLNTYMKKDLKSSQELLKTYIIFCEKYLKTGDCCDKACMDKVMNIYLSLQDIIKSNQNDFDEMTSKVFNKNQLYEIIDGSEKDDCKLLAPLSNELRLKILKILSKRGMYYTQLEREVGLKGGHFHFHLDKLIEGKYVIQEGEKGLYNISIIGLKALKFLFELKNETFLKIMNK